VIARRRGSSQATARLFSQGESRVAWLGSERRRGRHDAPRDPALHENASKIVIGLNEAVQRCNCQSSLDRAIVRLLQSVSYSGWSPQRSRSDAALQM
jgi:hypothetical protein